MPIQRFRDFDEAREALWAGRDDPHLPNRIRRLWAFAAKLAPGSAPRGIRRLRTIEEANRDREEWTTRRARTLREARLRR